MRSPNEKTWLKAFRQDALSQQSGRCCYCRSELLQKHATGDHIVARARNGKTTRGNISAACRDCNRLKGSMSATGFKRMIKNPEPGDNFEIWMAWSRRRIAVRVERACERIMRAVS